MDAVRNAVEVEAGSGHVAGAAATTAMVELHWIPVGSGQHVVRLSGKVYEWLAARWQRRPPAAALYHSALTVETPSGRWVIEVAPVIDRSSDRRGVVGDGPVGSRWLGRLRVFRYEVRCWRDGEIPDVAAAASTQHLDVAGEVADRVIEAARSVPTPVWGRDELHAGEMWNSNSVTSWLLVRSGFDMSAIGPPDGGRAPGWDAGLVVASRAAGATSPPPFT